MARKASPGGNAYRPGKIAVPHVLILGMTESGKTSLARAMCHAYKARGISTLVLDPLNDPRWQADFQTSNPADFLRVYWANKKCAAFIDEGGLVAGRFDDTMITTATQGRHWGHNNHYISQRATLLSLTIREQCSELYLFAMAKAGCKSLAEDFNKPQLLEASEFLDGTYFRCGRFIPLSKHVLFPPKKRMQL